MLTLDLRCVFIHSIKNCFIYFISFLLLLFKRFFNFCTHFTLNLFSPHNVSLTFRRLIYWYTVGFFIAFYSHKNFYTVDHINFLIFYCQLIIFILCYRVFFFFIHIYRASWLVFVRSIEVFKSLLTVQPDY